MPLEPFVSHEARRLARRPAHYAARTVVLFGLLILAATAWQALVGLQSAAQLGRLAQLNGVIFPLFAFLQVVLTLFVGTVTGALKVSVEKDRRSLELILLTRLSDSNIVLGKWASAMLPVLAMIFITLPAFFFLLLLGGISFDQLFLMTLVTLSMGLLSVSVGSVLAFWRERAYPALALSILFLIVLIAGGHALEFLPPRAGLSLLARAFSPFVVLHDIFLNPNAQPTLSTLAFALFSGLASASLLAFGIKNLRVWNPVRIQDPSDQPADNADQETSQVKSPANNRRQRKVWKYPVPWREICTQAYGKRQYIIKLAYLLVASLLALPLIQMDRNQASFLVTFLPVFSLVVLSLLLINTQSVTSITLERDLRCLELLIVGDISPLHLIAGKLAGITYNVKEMIFVPMLLFGLATWLGVLPVSGLVLALVVYAVLVFFTMVVGLHAGLRQPTTELAVAHSLGTTFLLFAGTGLCLVLIVISGQFSAQWASFLLIVVLGSIGLWQSLSANAPSQAIGITAALLPFATFYSLTSLTLGQAALPALVLVGSYGFGSAALLVPMLSEFDVSIGRESAQGD